MGTENTSAPPRAQSAPADNPTRTRRHGGGIVHENTRHTTRFVVIGNHLVQHKELSLLAIGLSCHLQSLPAGAGADIKSLAARFPEGPTRIAAALRELEAHGYLRRERHRTETGRIVTRTVSCNQPHADRRREPADTGCPPAKRTPPPQRRTVQKALPAVPQPSSTAPALFQTALDLLADMRRRDARLLLSATDTAHLVPGVAAWLERDVTPGAVRHALTAGLPDEPLHRPAALLAHRLVAQLPPPPPFRAPAGPPPPRYEVRNCDGCDRGFRAPETEDRCRDCRAASHP
ncbi:MULTISPECIES: helix-turn-helix domain-containing protein [Streptomyces violaceoruber group]|uniref:Helix-turn-helix domain-containing protein n=1 Tax=Streptomyces rubrogriseus TaxID=194673 RepID=A0ABT4NU79_9ACTN|nr:MULTISPECIES: helix-turn-helix domain-containing protein [Streptomyces anthocyanicus group]MCW8117927.1 helix-turn-helix domain-containing protein [Streptomyces anthocyanicus]MCZ4632672.1 helix-turn-helix domain-containing protein [Streptomyces rubrogriseus]